jgi:hypothetical protein
LCLRAESSISTLFGKLFIIIEIIKRSGLKNRGTQHTPLHAPWKLPDPDPHIKGYVGDRLSS